MYRYTSVWRSDGSIERSDDERRVSGDGGESDREIGNLDVRCRKRPKTPRRFVTAGFINLSNVSSYSPSSGTTHGCPMDDTTSELASETESGVGCGDASQVELRLRVRRFDEENAGLREDLVRAEELVTELDRKSDHLRRKLDQANDRCTQLEREAEEYREIIHEIEKKERECRWALRKSDKERELLAKKVEDAEAEKYQTKSLTSQLETLRKEKLEAIKEAIKYRQDMELKQAECDSLREKLSRVEETTDTRSDFYENTIRHLRENNEDLKSQIFDLQIERSVDSPTEIVRSTPPTSYLHSYMQSTSYVNSKELQLQDSLYTEIKASGFSMDDTSSESRIHELEDELMWYNEEIRDAVQQIDNILERVSRHRRTPYVPDLDLNDSNAVKTADIYEFSHKLAQLANTVNEIIWKPKVKDATSQVCALLASSDEEIYQKYRIPRFEDWLRFIRENRESATEERVDISKERRKRDVFVEAFSMNSRLLGEYLEEVEVAEEPESYLESVADSSTSRESMSVSLGVQEHTIIDPIVEEIDRILQCTNPCEEESPTKNPRHRCIYTCAQPATDLISLDNSSTKSSPNSAKKLEREFAATYVISSGGDAPSVGMVNHSNANGDNTVDQSDSMVKIHSYEDSNTFGADSASKSKLDSSTLEDTESLNNETAAEESIESKDQDTKLVSLHPDSLLASSTLQGHFLPATKLFVVGRSEPRDGNTYCVTPKVPKRKLSVYQRSFDIGTEQCGDGGGGSDTYRLTERSMSTPGDPKQTKLFLENMELDQSCMKQSSTTRNCLLSTYRTKGHESDSSGSPSPARSLESHRENTPLGEIPARTRSRPVVLAPTKLKLPLLSEIHAYVGVEKKTEHETKVHSEIQNVDDPDTEIIKNETRGETYVFSNIEGSEMHSAAAAAVTEAISIGEMIRPGDEIDRGITYRRSSIGRETDYSAYSLLSSLQDSTNDNTRHQAKIESASAVVMSDGDSTSCDSSPKRENPVAQSTLKLPLVSTNEKLADRTYSHQDLAESRGSRHVGRLAELLYQTRNDSIGTSGVGCYGSSGGGNGGTRSSVEKASVVPAVALAMSSGEDTSDSECDPMVMGDNEERRNVVDEIRSTSPAVESFADGAVLSSSTPAPIPIAKTEFADVRGNCAPRNPTAQKRDKKEGGRCPVRRSLSEGGCGRTECSCRYCIIGHSTATKTTEERPSAFPSLSDARLHESGISVLSKSDELGENITEADLEKKYTALSIGLVTDRVTLPRRTALSIRQRDQSEINLASEVLKMQQDIQDLAPLCIDRESVERVERVRHQLEMINQCTHRVSCTAETLGAVHQENRVSRAVLLADRYLRVLRSRCVKLTSDLAETKRILTENNIVVEENNGELGDDIPRIRYRGMPANNRTMMARRRASIATIFRPLGNFQDITKDGVRQRNSVSGRVTLRRPSLSAESQKWEADKLDRTDSSSSIGELREIFEQAESRRASREENNNILRLHSSNLSIRDCEHGDGDVWTNLREEPVAGLPAIVNGCQETRVARKSSVSCWSTNKNQVPWKLMLWCIIISFVFGFYMKHVVSSVSTCSATPVKWWSIEEFLERYVNAKNDGSTPI